MHLLRLPQNSHTVNATEFIGFLISITLHWEEIWTTNKIWDLLLHKPMA